MTTEGGDITGAAGAGGGVALRSSSWLPSWLLPRVGVEAWGVICCGPSSSSEDESPSSMAAICRWSSSSRWRAASISARWAASFASFSLASATAAFFRFFSSSFLSFPWRTCSSKAFRRAEAASRSLASSVSCCLASLLFPVSLNETE